MRPFFKKNNALNNSVKMGAYASIYESSYSELLKILKECRIISNAEQELLPLLYVISDYSCASAKKDREYAANEIMLFIQEKYMKNQQELDIFNKRVNFYGQVIRGRELRANWLYGSMSKTEGDAITRCGIAFCDILLNPDCADNYDNGSICLHDASEMFYFSEIAFNNILPLITELFKNIYKA